MQSSQTTKPAQLNKSVLTAESLRVQDILYQCLAHWYWFILSVLLSLGLATWYILKTPPVYNRTASVLIKSGEKGQGGDVTASFSEMASFRSNTNINNEIQTMQSPAVLFNVVSRLHLDKNYYEEGTFYRRVLYGKERPYEVQFLGLEEGETASFSLIPQGANHLLLTEFKRNGEEIKKTVKAALNHEVATPLGRLIVKPMSSYKKVRPAKVFVERQSFAAAVATCASSLSIVQASKENTVLTLSYQDVCPQRAEDILNTLITVYNETWVEEKNRVAVSTSQFIDERIKVIERELGNVENSISDFKSQNLISDVQAASGMYMNKQSEADAQLLNLATQLSLARYMKTHLSTMVGKDQLLPSNSGIANSGIESQVSEYNAMILQRDNLARSSSEENPLVQDLNQSLQQLRTAILISVDNYLASLQTQISHLQQSDNQTKAKLAANPGQAKYLLSIERQQKVKESLYLYLLKKREENELSQAFTAYNTRIITPPSGSMVPIAPVRNKILLVALGVGLLLPIGVFFLKEISNSRVRGRRDLERLTVPFAGEIPEGWKTKDQSILRRQKKQVRESRQDLIIQSGKRDILNEAFRVLRTNMEFMIPQTNRASVSILTSFNAGSGKTFICINVAASFVLKGKKVVIVDGDMRHASLSSYVGSPKVGLSDYLAGHEDNVMDLLTPCEGHDGLFILPVGTLPPNPTELLSSPRMTQLLEILRDGFDEVFIDCPPVDVVADTQIIEQLADQTFFVVRAGLMEREMIPEIQKIYDEKRFKNMSLILNATQRTATYGRYGNKYGYNYGYGSYGAHYYYAEK